MHQIVKIVFDNVNVADNIVVRRIFQEKYDK